MKPRPLQSATTLSIVMLPITNSPFLCDESCDCVTAKGLIARPLETLSSIRKRRRAASGNMRKYKEPRKATPRIRALHGFKGRKLPSAVPPLLTRQTARPLFYASERLAPGCQPHPRDLQKLWYQRKRDLSSDSIFLWECKAMNYSLLEVY